MTEDDARTLARETLASLGIRSVEPEALDSGADFVLLPGGVRVTVKYRSLIDGAAARHLLESRREPGTVLLAVGKRVVAEARQALVDAGAGFFDLRGHVAMRASTLVVDTRVPALVRSTAPQRALAGQVGLEVAVAVLMNPKDSARVRPLARALGRSPSAVSQALQALASEDLVQPDGVHDDRLFWLVAEHWRPESVLLAEPLVLPDRRSGGADALRINACDPESTEGWALTDAAAAGAYGAPIAVRQDQRQEFYVPSTTIARRAETLLGTALSSRSARCQIKIAPVPAVCRQRFSLPSAGSDWPLAHPVFVALDLAQDVGRGREILSAWNPPDRWTRVW